MIYGIPLETILQYGVAGLALYFMYNITFNHLKTIESTLLDIKEAIEKLPR